MAWTSPFSVKVRGWGRQKIPGVPAMGITMISLGHHVMYKKVKVSPPEMIYEPYMIHVSGLGPNSQCIQGKEKRPVCANELICVSGPLV